MAPPGRTGGEATCGRSSGKTVKDLEANKSNRYVPPASPHPAGHQWNSRISRSRGSLVIFVEQLKRTVLLAILPSCHPDHLKITFHLADIALHSPGHQLLCVGGASGGGPLSNNRIAVVSSPFMPNGLNETEWVVSVTPSSQLDTVFLLLNNIQLGT